MGEGVGSIGIHLAEGDWSDGNGLGFVQLWDGGYEGGKEANMGEGGGV